ncbi:protein phosphatase [Enemella evansiae]|uniref:PP2C family protein-serine/threonine phosphatase n=1 Tax=Enemella evansiae TaxID=2016499 RepID=UPI000B97AB53|nr:protein phosphatase 2C domain-containing protein [Enemella evansiae]OYN96229.1 protein phosphatase [Enemella evansiae]
MPPTHDDDRTPDTDLFLRYVAHSEIGLVRKNNQDSGYASPHLLVVADGMGGAAAGDLASAAAIQLIRRADRNARGEEPVRGEAMLELLAGALNQANDKIADLVADDHSLDGMGTTVTGAMFDGAELGLVHIGDSRAYLLRDGELTRLTHDHSWVQSLVDEGKITEAEAAFHPHRSLLLKVVNGQPAVEPDTDLVPVNEGDRLLLCSDGLCGLVEDDELSRILTRNEDPDAALQALIDAAHREGGIDNITIIVADVVGDSTAATTGAKILGAATEREVPIVTARPVDLGDRTPTRRTDAEGNTIPDSPAPQSSPPDEETSRYAPREAPRGGRWRLLLAGLVVLILLAAGATAGWAWSRTQYFVGPADGKVAINRGLSQQVLGVSLSEVYRIEDTALSDLPPVYRDRVEQTITSTSLPDAEATVAELQEMARQCVAQREARLTPEPTPTPVPPGAPGNPPGAPPTESAPPTPTETEPSPTPSPATLTPTPAGGEC